MTKKPLPLKSSWPKGHRAQRLRPNVKPSPKERELPKLTGDEEEEDGE